MVVNRIENGTVSKSGINSVANVIKQKSNKVPDMLSKTKVTSGAAMSAIAAVGLYIITKGKSNACVKAFTKDIVPKTKGEVCSFIESATQNAKTGVKPGAENVVSNTKQGVNTAKNVIVDLRTPKTGHILALMNKFRMSDTIKSRILNFEQEFGMVTDTKVKEYINAKLDEIIKPNYNNSNIVKDLREIGMLTDASNELAGRYTKINTMTIVGTPSRPTKIMEFAKFVKKSNSSITEILSSNIVPNQLEKGKNSIKSDLALEGKLYSMRQYIKSYPKNEISNHLYSKYLSLMSEYSKETLDCLKTINNKYNVKIFVPSKFYSKSFTEVMDYIDNELAQWVKASNGAAKLPPAIDFSTAKTCWYDTFAAHGQSTASAYSECGTRALAFSRLDKNTVSWALRHEMTHSNDLKLGKNIPTKYNLDEIMPKKIIERNGRNISVPDFKNCKYKDEFRKGKPDILDGHICYAYNNTKEFIAIAAEGDMSKYSPEFKQMLIDFGMPEWMFKMEPKQ